MKLCSISVDLDEIPNYYAIHGLTVPASGATAVYDRALDRLDDWARSGGFNLTLFAIGRDMERAEAAARLRRCAEAGHEIGNHSLDHLYDLTRVGRDEMVRQVEEGARRLREATGERPTGFRAPGYTITDELFEVLAEAGVFYDSSVFPCPPYYAAKAFAIAAIFARGRKSKSVLDRPSVLFAPTQPYRTGRPFWKRGAGMLELPIQVTRFVRLPFFGTTLTMAGPDKARWLTQMVAGEPFINLELHGMDVVDATDGFPELVGRQPDAAIPHQQKLEALTAVVETLQRRGYSFVRLDEAARRFA